MLVTCKFSFLLSRIKLRFVCIVVRIIQMSFIQLPMMKSNRLKNWLFNKQLMTILLSLINWKIKFFCRYWLYSIPLATRMCLSWCYCVWLLIRKPHWFGLLLIVFWIIWKTIFFLLCVKFVQFLKAVELKQDWNIF